MDSIEDLQRRYAQDIHRVISEPSQYDTYAYSHLNNLEKTYGIRAYGRLGFFSLTSVFIRDETTVRGILIHNRTYDGIADTHESAANYVKSKLPNFDCSLEQWSHQCFPSLGVDGKYVAYTTTSTEEIGDPVLFRAKRRAIVQCLRDQKMTFLDMYLRGESVYNLYRISTNGAKRL